MTFSRRARGVLVMALLWALVWVVVWLAVAPVLFSVDFPPAETNLAYFLSRLWRFLLPPTVWGTISGATFAGFVAVLGSRRGWNALGIRHALVWGALSGLAGPIVLTAFLLTTSASDWLVLLTIALVSVALNAALAAGTIALAKRGEPTP